MFKTTKRIVSLILAVLMMSSVIFMAVSCKKPDNEKDGDKAASTYTYKTYTTALGDNWNPHTWDTNADQSMLGYVSSPFVDMSILDSKNGVYQWVYEMATSVEDVTKANQGDLTKYKVTLPEGVAAADVESGYVFEIKLNKDAKWETGEKITADDYIESMKRLLDSKMRNYRANLYIAGESALAGAMGFYNSEAPIYAVVVPAYGEGQTPDYSFDVTKKPVYLNLSSNDMTIASYSFSDFITNYNFVDSNLYKKVQETENAYGYTQITNENKDDVLEMMDQYLSAFGESIYTDAEKTKVNEEYFKEFLFYFTETYGEKVEYDAVGCYKVDDYTIRYVCQTAIGYNYFLTSCTDTWLVHIPTYDKNKDDSGELVTTSYGTSLDTTVSYGTYKMESLQDGKQVVFVQNENWYGFEKQEDGSLISYTNFKVDGEKRQQYQTQKIVIDVMEETAAKNAFLKGELSDWSPSADELSTYALSSQLYQVDQTYTMSFFFNTNVDNLKTMDASKGNQNSVVLSNENFRKAFSLAIDRAEFVTATQGYKPAFSLLNKLYYYDIYDDDKNDGLEGGQTQYRGSEAAMQAIVNLYGVEYGADKAYKTLKEAHDSITGYNLTEAKKLMKTACDELVTAGLYTKGQEIKIKIGWAKGALTSDDNKQITLMNKYINEAIVDSGFGKVTFEGVGNIPDRYSDVPKGEYAIGYGAWGGAAFYPFRNFQVYMDPDQYDVNEVACWDPKTETLTLTVEGKEYTMTYQAWSNSMIGNGEFASASNAVKLQITAMLEQDFLEKYYRIPLCSQTACSMLSFQVQYYTEEYNIMYGFGGLRLMTYKYDDAQWAKLVKENNGQLDYT